MSKMVRKKKKKRFTKIKKLLAGTVALVLVVGLTIAGTLAYLKTESNQVTNTFVATKGINLTLVEPNFEKDKANNYFPGVTYKKDPILVNTSDEGTADGNQEWVMIRVDYSYKKDGRDWTDVNRSTFVKTIASGKPVASPLIFFEATAPNVSTGFNDNWIKLTTTNTGDSELDSATYELYLYKYKLKQDTTTKGYADAIKANSASPEEKRYFCNNIDGSTTTLTARTTPLFDSVTIIDQSSLEDIAHPSGGGKKLAVTDLPKFDINVIGAAVKVEADSSGIDTLDAGKINSAEDSLEKKIVADLVPLLKDKTPQHSS